MPQDLLSPEEVCVPLRITFRLTTCSSSHDLTKRSPTHLHPEQYGSLTSDVSWQSPQSDLLICNTDTHEDVQDDAKMDQVEDVEEEHDILLRCTHGDHSKFSTRVSLLDLNSVAVIPICTEWQWLLPDTSIIPPNLPNPLFYPPKILFGASHA
jgi:hypothetical protein